MNLSNWEEVWSVYFILRRVLRDVMIGAFDNNICPKIYPTA